MAKAPRNTGHHSRTRPSSLMRLPIRKGASEVETLLGRRHLERVTWARADGSGWLKKASQRLQTAAAIVADDPESAFVLAYAGWESRPRVSCVPQPIPRLIPRRSDGGLADGGGASMRRSSASTR